MKSGRIRKIQFLAGALAIVFALVLGTGSNLSIQRTSAAPLTTSTSGWNPENFESSCKAAGGRHIPIDQGDIKYSKCVFPDGSVNKCDWIKKICTFGIVSGSSTGGTGTGSKVSSTSSRTTSATLIVEKND